MNTAESCSAPWWKPVVDWPKRRCIFVLFWECLPVAPFQKYILYKCDVHVFASCWFIADIWNNLLPNLRQCSLIRLSKNLKKRLKALFELGCKPFGLEMKQNREMFKHKSYKTFINFWKTWNGQSWSKNVQPNKISATFVGWSRFYDHLKQSVPWVPHLL